MPRIVDKEEKRERILEAAISVFAKKGTANTKMAEIAEAAEIGKGTLYEYFQNKEDILLSAFMYVLKKAEADVSKKLAEVHEPLEKLTAYILVWKDIMKSDFKDHVEIMLDIWAESIRHKEETTAAGLNRIYRENRLLIKSILDECLFQEKIHPVNTGIVASIIIGVLDGLLLQWIMQPEIIDIDESLEEIAGLISRGLRIRER
ncbi:MAG: TetR/AcrR family transcriptional regulator [Candidatus Aminicenantales bacterium]